MKTKTGTTSRVTVKAKVAELKRAWPDAFVSVGEAINGYVKVTVRRLYAPVRPMTHTYFVKVA